MKILVQEFVSTCKADVTGNMKVIHCQTKGQISKPKLQQPIKMLANGSAKIAKHTLQCENHGLSETLQMYTQCAPLTGLCTLDIAVLPVWIAWILGHCEFHTTMKQPTN